MSIGNGFIKLTVMQPNFIEELEIKGKEYIKKNELLKYIFKIQENTEFETTNEKEDITLKIRRIEKRTNGIIVTDIFKIYSSIDYSDNIQILSNLSEKQLIFTKNKLEQNLENFHFNDTKACDILSRLKKLDNNKLQTLSDYNNSFSICINKNKTIKNMFNKNNILPIQVILNGTNISNMYNSIQGYDKLSRIHELYNGIITPRNEKDINGIKIGLLNSKCFDLKTLKGININIDNLVGDKVDIPYEYLEYLKKIFRNKYEYTGDINLTRDELLKIILNKPKKTSKNSVLIKKLS